LPSWLFETAALGAALTGQDMQTQRYRILRGARLAVGGLILLCGFLQLGSQAMAMFAS
jgi:hypothetical protein